MKKEVIIRADDNGNFKLPRFTRLFDSKNKKYKVLYKGKEYIKEKGLRFTLLLKQEQCLQNLLSMLIIKV